VSINKDKEMVLSLAMEIQHWHSSLTAAMNCARLCTALRKNTGF